ncbi:MAG: hypothetical protein U9Q68_04135 [Euryarchaeota archaeon]|nr:hypothetical protein [Euryarchaeota archaeon]
MKSIGWEIRFGLSLIILSALLYILHYAIFRDSHHIFIYMLGHIAFVPIEVLLVALILQRLLDMREKRAMLNKLNMVIGAFFSEVGDDLLAYFSECDIKLDKIRKELVITDKWSDQEFMDLSKRLKNYDYRVDIQNVDLGHLQSSLARNRNFLLRLLENPNLLEHESFTDLLRAVFHLTEELAKRGDLKNLPDTDYNHLSGDMKRVYTLLIHEWLDYMRHLKDDYPYLFSLAMRTNPFDRDASPIVR